MLADPAEVQEVKDALARTPQNFGIGVLHEPTGQIVLAPFDRVPGGHAELASDQGWGLDACRGFVVTAGGQGKYVVVNHSHLNGLQGQPGSLKMPSATFDAIRHALQTAGL